MNDLDVNQWDAILIQQHKNERIDAIRNDSTLSDEEKEKRINVINSMDSTKNFN